MLFVRVVRINVSVAFDLVSLYIMSGQEMTLMAYIQAFIVMTATTVMMPTNILIAKINILIPLIAGKGWTMTIKRMYYFTLGFCVATLVAMVVVAWMPAPEPTFICGGCKSPHWYSVSAEAVSDN